VTKTSTTAKKSAREQNSGAKDSASTAPELKGWHAIAQFLGMPLSTAQRWAKSGMPVTRRGRNVYGVPEELNRWLDRDSGLSPAAHIAAADADLSAELKQSLAQIKKKSRIDRVK
jgi:hypothetical protein